ncbi:MAG: toxin-antitoxin system HicB family antitoxin [Chloroflexota bacterium]|nr:toxin-antitoxin system HicB family antitoxin [Chloroflexota bacterium]
MKLTLELPEELERELAAEAAQQGLSLPEYALQLLHSHTKEAAINVQTGADLVDYWQQAGLIGMRNDIEDSQAHARTLRAQAERRSFDAN